MDLGNRGPTWYYDLTETLGFFVVAESAINGSYVVQNKYDDQAFFRNAYNQRYLAVDWVRVN